MFDLLASVNIEDLALLLSLIGGVEGGRYLHGKITSSSGRPKDNGEFSQKLCDEKHKNIDQTISDIKAQVKEGFEISFKKLDQMNEHILGMKK